MITESLDDRLNSYNFEKLKIILPLSIKSRHYSDRDKSTIDVQFDNSWKHENRYGSLIGKGSGINLERHLDSIYNRTPA